MADNRFYIPIASTSLAHFWGSGLIMPSCLYTKTAEKAQPISTALILLKQPFVLNANCSLEIILADAECKELVSLEGGIFRYNSCLPVTRIINIYFRTQEQLKTTVWNITQGTAFIPERLLKVLSDSPDASLNLNAAPQQEIKDLCEKAGRFNVILGGLAFMRMAYEGSYKHAENYFATLGYFDAAINNRVTWYRENKGIIFDYRYTGLFSSKESEWSRWIKYIYQGVTLKEFEELAKTERVPLKKSLSGFKTDGININSVLYDMALLAMYGDNKQKSIEDLIYFLFSNKIAQSKIEEIALLFGLQTGYSKLRSRYKVNGQEIDIKFRLEKQLDYSIIESIFEFVFYGKNFIANFDFLEPALPKASPPPANVTDGDFLVMDVVATSKKKIHDGPAFDPVSETDFFHNIARAIYKWGVPYDTEDRMLSKAQQYLTKNFGPDLKRLLQSAGKPEETSQQKEVSAQKPQDLMVKKYNDMTWADLKKMASSNGISVPKSKKGTLKDFLTLIEQIEGTKTIL